MLIEIYRFSKDGFIPKYQNKIAEEFTFWKNYKLTQEEEENTYKGRVFQQTIDKMKNLDINNLSYSLFSFIDKPSYEYKKLLLNHLSNKEKVKRTWWKAVIDDSALIYADGNIVGKVEQYDKFILKDLLQNYHYYNSIIIPNISINKISNIERIDPMWKN